MEHIKPRQKSPEKGRTKDQDRKDRLKAALKANMAKRKAQTKGRHTTPDPRQSSEKDRG